MKDYPQNSQEWAEEAHQAMTSTWDELTRFTPFPSESQKEKLIPMAVTIACENRDITDSTFVAHAHDYAKEEFMVDYNSRDIGAVIDFSLCFLLAYFDAHLALSMLPQEIADDAMAILRSQYDLSYAGKNQTNVLSINYFGKA